MEKKKYLATLSTVVAGIVLSQGIFVSALNAEKSEIAYKNGEVFVPVVSNSGEAVTYQVYTGDAPGVGTIRGFGEEYPENKKCTLVFGLKETNEYKVRISDGDDTIVVDGIVYASTADREDFVDDVNDALAVGSESAANIEAAANKIHSLLVDAANYKSVVTIGVNIDEYVDFSSKIQDEICRGIAKSGANDTLTESEFFKLYREEEAKARINNGTETDGENVVKRLNLEFEGVSFDEISETSKQEWIAKTVVANKPYDSMDAIQKGYEKANVLYLINTARVTNVEATIRKYAELLEVSTDKRYTTYLKQVSSSVNRALVEELASDKVETPEELLDLLKEVIADLDSSGSKGGSSGGGFGGGGTVKGNYEIGGTQIPVQGDADADKSQSSPKFSDVPETHWAYDAIMIMQSEGIISGYGNGTFLPEQTVKREEFVKMIIMAFGLENETASSYFHDVFDSDWFYPYISVAFEKGIVKGDNLGLFGVNAGITREDATVIASRVLKLMDKSTEATRDYDNFADEDVISDYAKEAVRELYCMGRINGTNDGKFEPQRFCTRAEAAMIIYNISR